MQKLLLLLTLSFFSTQGLASSCPDGSEPEKTVSADGTYFLYECAVLPVQYCKHPNKVYDVRAPAPIYEEFVYGESTVDQILSKRRTINPFAAWSYGPYVRDQYPQKFYPLAWTANWRRKYDPWRIELFTPSWINYVPQDREYNVWKDEEKQKSYAVEEYWAKFESKQDRQVLDIRKTGFADDLAEEIEYQLTRPTKYNSEVEYHGVMFDWWTRYHPVPWSGDEIDRVRTEIARTLRDKFGPEFLITGNVNWFKNRSTLEYTNGVFLELHKDHSSEPYSLNKIREIEQLLTFYDNNLVYPKLIALDVWKVNQDDKPVESRYSKENTQFARMFTAMSAVIPQHGYILYGDNNSDVPWADHEHIYYDFFEVDLGLPKSEFMKIKQGLGYRVFEKGTIVYNSTTKNYRIEFDEFSAEAKCMNGLFLDSEGVEVYKFSEDSAL